MQTIPVKICTGKHHVSPHDLFILSKGNNAGRPLQQPCPNCFVARCSNAKEREMLYWICYALWESGKFRYHLVGSVVEFLRIRDVRNLIQLALTSISRQQEDYEKFVAMLQRVLIYEEELGEQVKKIRQLKTSLTRGIFKNLPTDDISPLSQS